MTATYYVEGIYYATLTDLLSEGWPEDKQVDIWSGGRPSAVSSVARLRREVASRRTVAVANEGFAERVPAPGTGYQYATALITEDSPGWVPGRWHRTLQEAQAWADSYNRVNRHTSDEVLEVQVSSMRATRIH